MNNNEIEINIENDNIDIDTELNKVVYKYVEYDDTEVRELIQENSEDIEALNTDITSLNTTKANKSETYNRTQINDFLDDKADKTEIPDVSNFITNTVDNLVSYYKKSETYTQTEVNSLISAISTMNILVVQTLPTQDISTTTIYLLPRQTSETNNVYDEYIYVSNNWEKIGSTEIDLSNYYTKAEVDTLISNIDLSNYYTKTQVDTLIPDISGKQDTLVSGTNIKTINNESILGSGNINIQGGSGGGDEIFIGDEQDAPQGTKLVIDDEYVDFGDIEIVNTLSGNEINKAPSVWTVNHALGDIVSLMEVL